MKALDKYGVKLKLDTERSDYYDGVYTGTGEVFFDKPLGVKRIMRYLLALGLIMLGLIAITSCGDDDRRDPPTIGMVELVNTSRANSQYAYAGDTLECRAYDLDGASRVRAFMNVGNVRTPLVMQYNNARFSVPYGATGTVTCEVQAAYRNSSYSGIRSSNSVMLMGQTTYGTYPYTSYPYQQQTYTYCYQRGRYTYCY